VNFWQHAVQCAAQWNLRKREGVITMRSTLASKCLVERSLPVESELAWYVTGDGESRESWFRIFSTLSA
jgi:hypothetical protein